MLHLRDTLIERVEQGVPLECLNLRSCTVGKRAIKLLAEIVVDVDAPNRDGGISYYNGAGVHAKWVM
jgi:hypothetical protein